jgi:hypothetical protein
MKRRPPSTTRHTGAVPASRASAALHAAPQRVRLRRARKKKVDLLALLALAGCIVTVWFTHSETVRVIAFVAVVCVFVMDDMDGPLLEIRYRGAPVTLDLSKLNAGLCVPTRGTGERLGDVEGAIAAALFNDAIATGAIIAPAGVRIECYADDDETGGGIILIAFPDSPSARAGVTTGWRDTRNIAAEEHQDPHDPELVAAALEFIAAELNTALLWS